jgi:hypothetical protein
MIPSTKRRAARPVELLRSAAGPPRGYAGKLARLARILAAYGDRPELAARLARLRERGVIDVAPSGVQLVVGSADMLRFWISPASADYYRSIGIGYGFHQLLRFLDEPASLADPVGFFSTKAGIIGHLMQVVHANPVYDLQLLQMFHDGLDTLEAEIEAMLEGTHPRAGSIGAIVEEADYHARLLEYVRAWRRDPTVPPMLRRNIQPGGFGPLERTFGNLPGAMRYFRRLPADSAGAALHLLRVRAFPAHLGELAEPPGGQGTRVAHKG